MVWLPDGKKFDDMFSRFDIIPCDGQTDIWRRRSPRYTQHCAVKKIEAIHRQICNIIEMTKTRKMTTY